MFADLHSHDIVMPGSRAVNLRSGGFCFLKGRKKKITPIPASKYSFTSRKLYGEAKKGRGTEKRTEDVQMLRTVGVL